MTNSEQLLEDLQGQVERLQNDLRQRVTDAAEFDRALRDEYGADVL